ncbi:MAG: tripartite tricarboxylate transporter permease [Actinobacteria bacterium]|nr:tripartite tricarboxylate transporter permease [Actinomycetota bacterium]
MENIHSLIQGFLLVITPIRLLSCFIGVTIGTIVGVLPGIGPAGTMMLLFPISINIDPLTGIIMLAGIYFGAMYGGSTTSILLNVPGEVATMVTCIDGYPMAKKGKAGAALAVSAIGSFIAGTVGIVVITFFAPWLGKYAIRLGPPEFFAITFCGLFVLSNITGGSPKKAFLGVILGVMLSTIGIDILTGASRFVFSINLSNGIGLAPFMIGLFGLSEVFYTVVKPYSIHDAIKVKFKDLYPKKEDLKSAILPMIRGTLIGIPIGLLPCPHGFISSMTSYKLEKAISKSPDRFGCGAIEGVAGPESANNASATTGLIPLLALGLPFTGVMAVLLAALMVHNVTPGPLFIRQHADLFWGVIASLYIGQIMLLVLNYPLVGAFASIAKVPPNIIMPLITGVVFVGVYSMNNSVFDMYLTLLFGIIGFVLRLLDFKIMSIVVGFVLGKVVEKSLRQGLILVDGNIVQMIQFLCLNSRQASGATSTNNKYVRFNIQLF